MKLEDKAPDLLKGKGSDINVNTRINNVFLKNKSHQFFVTSTMLISLPIQPFGKQLNKRGKKKK